MRYMTFQPRFARLVETGLKLQTVRPWRKDPIKVGETISLREWIGLPYRSKQRELKQVKIKSVTHVIINAGNWSILNERGRITGFACGANDFANADGFENSAQMFRWFEETHGPGDFHAFVIKW